MALQQERNQEATVWIGGLDENVDEDLLWELMIQAGPVKSVNIPRDKITREHSGYAFVEFKSEEDADYAMKIMNMVRLYGKALKINKASRDNKETGVGANIFVGNLDPDVDDQLLYRTFSTFGQVLSAKVMYEDDGSSRGFGFVNFADFDSADTAISNMNGQFLSNRPIHVSYAYKKEGMAGERHGSENERLLAQAQNQKMPPKHDNFNTSGFAMQKQLDSLKKTDTSTSDTNTNNNNNTNQNNNNNNITSTNTNTNTMRPPPVPPRGYYPPMYYPPPMPNTTGQQWRPPPVPFGYPPMNPFMPPPYPMMRPPPFPNMMPPPLPNKSNNAPPPPPKKT